MRDPPLTSSSLRCEVLTYLLLRSCGGAGASHISLRLKVVAEPTANSWDTTVVLRTTESHLNRSTHATRNQGSKEEPDHSCG